MKVEIEYLYNVQISQKQFEELKLISENYDELKQSVIKTIVNSIQDEIYNKSDNPL
jgi:hypothetical protein